LCKRLFECYNANNGLLIVLQGNSLESLLEKAKEHEKKYEWLQAAEVYEEASGTIKNISYESSAEIYEGKGFCLFKAAFQAQSNDQFTEIMTLAIQSYEKAVVFFEKTKKNDRIICANNIRAKISYAKSWIELNPSKKTILMEKWWTLKSKVLEAYEKIENKIYFAKSCNEMLQNSYDCYYWIGKDSEELEEKRNKLISLGEKAINILSTLNDEYELVRAYCWTSLFYLKDNLMGVITTGKEIKKGLMYSNKAIEISKKVGDANLVGWSFHTASHAANMQNDYEAQINFLNLALKQGKITNDNYLSGLARFQMVNWNYINSKKIDDPDVVRDIHKRNLQTAKDCVNNFKIINMTIWNPYFSMTVALEGAALVELDVENKRLLLKEAFEYGRKSIALVEGWKCYISPVHPALNAYSRVLVSFSEFATNVKEKRQILEELLRNTERALKFEQFNPSILFFRAATQRHLTSAKYQLSKIASNKLSKIQLLRDAENSIEVYRKISKMSSLKTNIHPIYTYYAQAFYFFGEIYYQLYLLTEESELLLRALEVYNDAITIFSKLKYFTGVAESNWQKAKIHEQFGKLVEAQKDYELAAEAYLNTAETVPHLKDFYIAHSFYMQAWSQIELARYSHSIEEYGTSKECYEKAAALYELTGSWNYLAPNFVAWASLEEAESLSRKENAHQAKQIFEKALQQFSFAKESIRQKLADNLSVNEKEMTQKLLQSSDIRCEYCQARILIEDAKLLDMKGKLLQSSKKYREAAQNIGAITTKIDVETERKELEYLAILCQAWEKMATAEETSSSEAYLEAAELFQQAKEYCYTSKATFWALGNSNFCKGLAAGARYQTDLELKEHAKAKSYMKNASTHYAKAGFKTASEYAKATQRLFDAYLFMNQAESESDTEKRVKQYQLVENLLQLAADSFMKAKQAEKTSQVKQILESVREEKQLAISFNKVLQAPSIASSTSSFSAPTSTSETSVGLENFEHANVQANLVTTVKQVKIGECFCISVEFVNAGREPALLMRVDDFVPSDFVVVKKPEIYRIEETSLNMKGKQLAPLKLVEVKLTLQPSKKGDYRLNPRVQYLDEAGKNKSLQLKALEIKVEEVLLENRVTTGTAELDSLLLGGIPKEYAVVLSGPPCDEREFLVKNFLKAGAKEEITFYISKEATALEELLENPSFYLFLCNPKPKVEVPDLSNMFKLHGKTDLTNLGIALIKAYRSIDQSVAKKRICVEILSEVLVKHGTNTTREWISSLITDLGAKGFTILAVMDPKEHPPDQATTVLNLFDGEISLTQNDDPLDCKKSIHVKKLRNQDYIKNPICLIEMKNQ